MSIIFADLKEAYGNAVKKKEETFELDNSVYLTAYAKYLIQYLEMQKVNDRQVIELVQPEM
jgi:hypothetical protein